MPLFPEPFVVVHVARVISDDIDPDTGNALIVDSDPVIRRAISIAPQGLRSSRSLFEGDSLLRTEINLDLTVSEPTVYAAGDQVVIDPELDGDGWIEGTGTAFRVNGEPNDSRQGPWRMLKVFGGVVRLRRVT